MVASSNPALGQAGPTEPAPANGYESMLAMDLRLATVGDRLARAAASRCSDKVYDAGLVLHKLDQYNPEDRAAVASYFGMTALPQIVAVVPDGAAANAGLQRGDSIQVVDGMAMSDSLADKGSAAGSETALDLIDKSLTDGTAQFDIVRDNTQIRLILAGTQRCHVRFQLVPGDTLKASTNGLNLKVSSAVLDLAETDDELAAIVAHEFSHVILKHPQALRAEGIKQGSLISSFGLGKGAKKIRAAEEAADRLSIHLLYDAGYDMRAAPVIWRRYLGCALGPINWDPTHGSTGKRTRSMEEEIAKIEKSGG